MRVKNITKVEWMRMERAFPNIKIGDQRLMGSSCIGNNILYAYITHGKTCDFLIRPSDIYSIVFSKIVPSSRELAVIMLKRPDQYKDDMPDMES
jgi:hypothetical protein